MRGVNLPSESLRLQLRTWGSTSGSLDEQCGEVFSVIPESMLVFLVIFFFKGESLKVNFFLSFTFED